MSFRTPKSIDGIYLIRSRVKRPSKQHSQRAEELQWKMQLSNTSERDMHWLEKWRVTSHWKKTTPIAACKRPIWTTGFSDYAAPPASTVSPPLATAEWSSSAGPQLQDAEDEREKQRKGKSPLRGFLSLRLRHQSSPPLSWPQGKGRTAALVEASPGSYAPWAWLWAGLSPIGPISRLYKMLIFLV